MKLHDRNQFLRTFQLINAKDGGLGNRGDANLSRERGGEEIDEESTFPHTCRHAIIKLDSRI